MNTLLFPRQEDANADDGGSNLYKYNPSAAAAGIFLALFILTTTLHTYQLVRTRTLYFIPFLVGGLFEVLGFIGRVAGVIETPEWTLGPYILMTLGTLLGPTLFAASLYMELGRIMLLVDGEEESLVRRTWMTKIFVTGDVVSFLMQCGGGGMLASDNPDSVAVGEKIVLGGLFVQIVFFGLFMINSVLWRARMMKRPTSLCASMPWQKHLFALFIASGLILVRSIFRVVEYIQGYDGYLISTEVYFYVLDVMLMFFVMVMFLWIHPSEVHALRNGGKVAKGLKIYEVAGTKNADMDLEQQTQIVENWQR